MTPLRQKGLSLIEVMIALAVFSFGLLALAALMASGLKYNTSALHRSYATNQAYDMADRMRANRLGLDLECYDGLGDSDTDPGCIESGCTQEQMAQYDSWQWSTDNARLLPQGKGEVRLKSSDPESADFGMYTITVTWKTSTAAETESFVFEFQP